MFTFVENLKTMNTIWKFELEDSHTIKIPAGFLFLTMQTQNGKPCIWVMVDTEAEQQDVSVFIYGTGQEITERKVTYAGTFQELDGVLIWHVFYKINTHAK